jgi:hypothetical protein
MNKLQPHAIAKIHESKLAFKQMENIANFLTAFVLGAAPSPHPPPPALIN